MIVPSQSVKIVIATKPVDFRKGHDGLAAVVQNELGLDHDAFPSAVAMSAIRFGELSPGNRTVTPDASISICAGVDLDKDLEVDPFPSYSAAIGLWTRRP